MLGSKACIEILKEELLKIDGYIQPIMDSTKNEMKIYSWKFPGKLAQQLDSEELLQAAQYDQFLQTNNERIHAFLLELLIDKFVVILQVFIYNLRKITTPDLGCSSTYTASPKISILISELLDLFTAINQYELNRDKAMIETGSETKHLIESKEQFTQTKNDFDAEKAARKYIVDKYEKEIEKMNQCVTDQSSKITSLENQIQTMQSMFEQTVQKLTESEARYKQFKTEQEQRMERVCEQRQKLEQELKDAIDTHELVKRDLIEERKKSSRLQNMLQLEQKFKDDLKVVLSEIPVSMENENSSNDQCLLSSIENLLGNQRMLENDRDLLQNEVLELRGKIRMSEEKFKNQLSILNETLRKMFNKNNENSSLIVNVRSRIFQIENELETIFVEYLQECIMNQHHEVELEEIASAIQNSPCNGRSNEILSQLELSLQKLNSQLIYLTPMDLEWLKAGDKHCIEQDIRFGNEENANGLNGSNIYILHIQYDLTQRNGTSKHTDPCRNLNRASTNIPGICKSRWETNKKPVGDPQSGFELWSGPIAKGRGGLVDMKNSFSRRGNLEKKKI